MKNQKGFILMTSYMLLATLSIASLAVFARGNSFVQATERNKNKIVAFNMAEAGIDLALTQLLSDPSYAGTNYTPLSTQTVQGGYQITVTTPVGFPNVRMIQAAGHAPSNVTTGRAYERRDITVFAELAEMNLFNFAVFSDQSLLINGNSIVDSYNSSNGPYGANNKGNNGDLGTNSTAASTLQLIGNTTVNGSAMVGPGGDPNVVISIGNNATLNGSTGSSSATYNYQTQTTNQISLGNLSLSGNTTLFLPAGTYRYSSISITGNAKLAPVGPVTIYVDGAVNIGGNGVATHNNLPPNFLLFASGTQTVKISGNGHFFGGVFAPKAPVSVSGNGSLYGAVVAKTYQQSGNGNLHYDQALNSIGGGGYNGINLRSWQEQNATAWV